MRGLIILHFFSCQQNSPSEYSKENWAFYLGDKSVSHYSQLDQINKDNVHNLKAAWVYHGGASGLTDRTQIQCNPLIIDGVLYGSSSELKLFALNAATGERLWQFDPEEYANARAYNRGLAIWNGETGQKLFYTLGAYLFAIDPLTGNLISSFGKAGKINLKEGLGREGEDRSFSANTPGIIYQDLYIVGGRVSETINGLPGDVRAFDVHTGEMKWIFHTIPHPGEFGYETWPENAHKKSGGANTWSGMSLDEERGIVYVPTGSASFDFYGGDRKGANLFANCIIALDAATGKRIWHYQTIHHDLFDYDLPAPPNLVTIEKEGKKIDALVQTTKTGYLFVLNRVTGEPLYPINEMEVPVSDLVGEESWPTQPIPTVYPAFSRTTLSEDDLATRSKEANAFAKELWDKSRKGKQFLPPSLQSTICFPGLNGVEQRWIRFPIPCM